MLLRQGEGVTEFQEKPGLHRKVTRCHLVTAFLWQYEAQFLSMEDQNCTHFTSQRKPTIHSLFCSVYSEDKMSDGLQVFESQGQK